MATKSDCTFIERAAFAIGDRHRLAILQEMAQHGEICCAKVREVTGLAQATCSHHLKLLAESELVSVRKEGKNHFYRLQPENFCKVSAYLTQLSEGGPVQ